MDNIDRLECVYYPGPIPKNGAVLITLSLIFDNIHFPGVHLPKGGYDKQLLQDEIARITATEKPDHESKKLIGILNYLKYRLPLDGMFEYPSNPDSIMQTDKDGESKLARMIYDVNHPARTAWKPVFMPWHLKGLPESSEDVIYAGDFHYQAGAIRYAAQKQLPLIDDGSWFPLPFQAQYKDNAPALATLMAIQSLELALPDLPWLNTQELVDFRMENKKELRAFRSAMLRYTRAVNSEISADMPSEEIARKTRYFIESEIAPALHDLDRDLKNPNRPWYRRFTDGVRVSSSILTGFLTGGAIGTTAADGIREALLSEVEGAGARHEAAKRDGLYYLLKAKALRD